VNEKAYEYIEVYTGGTKEKTNFFIVVTY